MSFTIYTVSDPASLGYALNAMALVFGHESWVASAIKSGLMFSLLFILGKGVLQNGLRLDQMFLQLLIIWAAFIPRTTVVVEQFENAAAPRVIDNIPYAIALPASAAGAFALFMTEKIELAISGVNQNYISVTGADHPFSPVKVLMSVAVCASDPLKCADPNVVETIRMAARYCAKSQTVDFAKTQDSLKALAVTFDPGRKTVIYNDSAPFVPGIGGGKEATCEDAQFYLSNYLTCSSLEDINYGPQPSSSMGNCKPHLYKIIGESGHMAKGNRYASNSGSNLPAMTANDVVALLNRTSDNLAKLETSQLANVMMYSIVDAQVRQAGNPLGQAVTVQRDMTLFKWAQDESMAAMLQATVAPKFMDVLFFIFVAATPIVMFIVAANPASGVKVAASYLLFGMWTQSWIPMMAIAMGWYQVELDTFPRPGGSGTELTPEYLAAYMRHVMTSTVAVSNMMTNAPFIMFAIMSGSMMAVGNMMNRMLPKSNEEMVKKVFGDERDPTPQRQAAMIANGGDVAAGGQNIGGGRVMGNVAGALGASDFDVSANSSIAAATTAAETNAMARMRTRVDQTTNGLLRSIGLGTSHQSGQQGEFGTGGGTQNRSGTGNNGESGVGVTHTTEVGSGREARSGSAFRTQEVARAGAKMAAAFKAGADGAALLAKENTANNPEAAAFFAKHGKELEGLAAQAAALKDKPDERAAAAIAARASQLAFEQAQFEGAQQAKGKSISLGDLADVALGLASLHPGVRAGRLALGAGGALKALMGAKGAKVPSPKSPSKGGPSVGVGGDLGGAATLEQSGGQGASLVAKEADANQENRKLTATGTQGVDNTHGRTARVNNTGGATTTGTDKWELSDNFTQMYADAQQSSYQLQQTRQMAAGIGLGTNSGFKWGQVAQQYGDVTKSGSVGEAVQAMNRLLSPIVGGDPKFAEKLFNAAVNEHRKSGNTLNPDQAVAVAAGNMLREMSNSQDPAQALQAHQGFHRIAQAAGVNTGFDSKKWDDLVKNVQAQELKRTTGIAENNSAVDLQTGPVSDMLSPEARAEMFAKVAAQKGVAAGVISKAQELLKGYQAEAGKDRATPAANDTSIAPKATGVTPSAVVRHNKNYKDGAEDLSLIPTANKNANYVDQMFGSGATSVLQQGLSKEEFKVLGDAGLLSSGGGGGRTTTPVTTGGGANVTAPGGGGSNPKAPGPLGAGGPKKVIPASGK